MAIGTIGAGDLAQPFAKQALKVGHKVKLSNSRGPESLREIVNQLGPGAMAATKEEAAACEVVLLAVPWDNIPETLASLPKWKSQILINGTNPFHGRPGILLPTNVGNLTRRSWPFGRWSWKSSRWRANPASRRPSRRRDLFERGERHQ